MGLTMMNSADRKWSSPNRHGYTHFLDQYCFPSSVEHVQKWSNGYSEVWFQPEAVLGRRAMRDLLQIGVKHNHDYFYFIFQSPSQHTHKESTLNPKRTSPMLKPPVLIILQYAISATCFILFVNEYYVDQPQTKHTSSKYTVYSSHSLLHKLGP